MHSRLSLVVAPLFVTLLLATLLIGACGGEEDGGGVSIGTVAATAEVTPTATPARTSTAGPTSSATSTPAATATGTATLVASPCPAASDACSFMSQVAQHVVAGNSDGVLSSSKPTAYTCPGPNGGPGGPFPLCNGARTGEIRLGYAMRRIGGESGAVEETEVVQLVAGWSARTEPGLHDEYGDGEARAYTVACPGVRPGESRSCNERFSLVFSGLSPGASAGQALRTMLVVDVQRDGEEYRAVGFATGVLDTGLELALRGGSGAAGSAAVPSALVGGPAGWSVVTFFPWAPIGLRR